LAAGGIPVAVTCRVLGIARQPYYRWLADPVTDAELEEAYRANALFDAHREDPEFGYRFLADEARDAGESMSDRTAWRICSINKWSVFGKKRGSKKGRSGPPVHDDLVGRVFTADAPNRLWLNDSPPSTPCREVPPPSAVPMRASCICVRSRTFIRIGSSATRSAIG